MIIRIFKLVISATAAVAVGFFGLSLFFSDLGPAETWLGRFAIAAALFFITGFGIGYFNPGVWLLSALAGWGGTMFGVSGLASPQRLSVAPALLLVSLGAPLLGGYLGSRLWLRLSRRGKA